MTDIQLKSVTESWSESELTVVEVSIIHDEKPHNTKTFKFVTRNEEPVLKNMNMKKSQSGWSWSEQEIISLPEAFEEAKKVAAERMGISTKLNIQD